MAYNTGSERNTKIVLFNKKSYQDYIFPYKTYINFVNFKEENKVFYGFRNKNNLEILPKSENLLFDDELDIVALDFVVYAYKELVDKYYSLLRDGQISSKSNINKYLSKPKVSQVGLDFQPILQKNSKEFNNKVITDQKLNLSTKNIFDYCDAYILNIPKLKKPIQTHLKFLNSNQRKNINGLTIDLVSKQFNNDQQKVDFISDLNFPVLRKLAEQYGFYINEDAPWQMIANLSHPNIKELISLILKDVKKEEITPDFIINKYYDILLFIDYEEQKKFLYNSYKELYDLRSDFSEAYYCAKKQQTNLVEVTRKEPPTLEDFLTTDELVFLNLYMRMLNSENGFKYDIIQLNNFSNNLSKLYRKDLDKQKALLYIYGKFQPLVP